MMRDVLIIGDGSGTGGWDHQLGLGWAAWTIDRHGYRKPSWGGTSSGPIHAAEFLAPLQGLWEYHNRRGRQRLRDMANEPQPRPLQVCVLSDNGFVVQTSKLSPDERERSVDGIWWAAWNRLCQAGYVAHFEHIPRVSLELNWACDQLAGRLRELVQNTENAQLTYNRDLVDERSLNPLR